MKAQDLTIEQLAGQRLMVGFDGTNTNDQLKGYIREFSIGGLILFSRNLKDPGQIQDLCGSAQEYAKSQGLSPLLISVDQEGGMVARLPAPFTKFPGNPFIRTPEEAVAFGTACASDLKNAGFNMDLAPVVDVLPDQGESIMAGRTFPGGPEEVAILSEIVIRTLQQNNILAVAKHFPGIGRTVLDSHLELPYCDVSLDELEKTDLVPFERAIKAEVSGIMLTHVAYPQLDREWPAGLSVKIARDLLRGQMGFDGLVLTDDLDMGAIAKHFSLETAIARTLAADVDLILICHPGPGIQKAHELLVAGIRENENLHERAILSAGRILVAKANLA